MFGKTGANRIEAAYDVFNKTINDLELGMKEIDTSIDKHKSDIKTLTTKVEILSIHKEKATEVRDNIKNLLGF